MLDLVTYLNETRIFDWYGSKKGLPKDVCDKESGLRAQNMLAILGLIVIVIGGSYLVVLWLQHF